MGKITLKDPHQEEESRDGESIQEVCEDKFNIPFGCKDGICGTCRIKVLEGNENLSEKNEQEKDMFPEDPTERLACQCTLKDGDVEIDTSY
jgi:ferredoxin